jgi:uridine kinase
MIRWKEEERSAIAEMRLRLFTDLKKIPQFPEVVGDRRLIRFYNGNGKDVDRAVEAYMKFLKWRKDNQVDQIRQNIGTVLN